MVLIMGKVCVEVVLIKKERGKSVFDKNLKKELALDHKKAKLKPWLSNWEKAQDRKNNKSLDKWMP